jgi:NAD(P)H-hydrate repair Nnr-like enzyme with NAD(P)H-hydrate dehydratase domain
MKLNREMDHTYWHKQTRAVPLFADLLWSRPENRAHAGKLLIVGGNKFGFAAPAEAFSAAEKADVGVARVLLPDALHKTLKLFEAGEYAPSTPSGSFAQKALADMLALANWADGVLLTGDVGRNSETAILLENFAKKHPGQLTITKDALDYFTHTPDLVLNRSDTTLVTSFAQFQKLATMAHFPKAFTFDMDLLRLVDTLHEFTKTFSCNIVVKHLENIVVASSGQVSTTRLDIDLKIWRVTTAASASVWWAQNPSQPFEALTTSLVS